jgi:hypothetical protein
VEHGTGADNEAERNVTDDPDIGPASMDDALYTVGLKPPEDLTPVLSGVVEGADGSS